MWYLSLGMTLKTLPWPLEAARISTAFIDIERGHAGGFNSFGMATILLSQFALIFVLNCSPFDWGKSWDILECNFDDEGLESAVNWARMSSAMEVAYACFGDTISLSCKCSDTNFWMSFGRSESVEVWTADDDDNGWDIPLDVWDLDVTLIPWVSFTPMLEECWLIVPDSPVREPTEGTPLSISELERGTSPPEILGLGNCWCPGNVSPDRAGILLGLASC